MTGRELPSGITLPAPNDGGANAARDPFGCRGAATGLRTISDLGSKVLGVGGTGALSTSAVAKPVLSFDTVVTGAVPVACEPFLSIDVVSGSNALELPTLITRSARVSCFASLLEPAAFRIFGSDRRKKKSNPAINRAGTANAPILPHGTPLDSDNSRMRTGDGG